MPPRKDRPRKPRAAEQQPQPEPEPEPAQQSGDARACTLLPNPLYSDCLDQSPLFGRRSCFPSSPPEPEPELEAAPEPEAVAPAAYRDDDAVSLASSKSGRGSASEVYAAKAAKPLVTSNAVDAVLVDVADAAAVAPPASLPPTPRLLLSKHVADWLLEVGTERGAVYPEDFEEYDDPASGKVWASQELSEELQSGKGVGDLLNCLLINQGNEPPFKDGELIAGRAASLRLRNWNFLAPVLSSYDIKLSSDAKTLLVAGEHEHLATLLAEIKERVSSGQNLPAGSAASAAATKRLAADRAAEKKELLTDSISQLVGLYGIVMAALLVLFVEQQCAPNANNPNVHQCTLNDDFNSWYEQAVLAVNFICLFVFVVANGIFWLRERFIIEHFSQDQDQPEDALPEELAAYPPFLAKLRQHNNRAYYASELMFVVLTVNFGVSAALILGKHYGGRVSVIGLLSNTFLCMSKIWGYRTLAKQCRNTDSAISLFESANKVLNAVADDKKFLPGIYDPESAHGGSKAYEGGGVHMEDVAAAGRGSRASDRPPEPPSPAPSGGSSRGSSKVSLAQAPPPPPREFEKKRSTVTFQEIY